MSRDCDFEDFAVLEALPEGMIVADVDQKIQFINSAACSLLKIDRQATLGTTFKSLPGSQELPSAEQIEERRRLLDSSGTPDGSKPPVSKPYEAIWQGRIKDYRFVQYRSWPILDVEQQPLGIVIRVSDAPNERTVSELLSTFYDEVLKPLGFIVGYAQTLLRESWSLDVQREFLQIIVEEALNVAQVKENFVAAQKRLQSDTVDASST